jgi:hypothetical protein
MSCLSVFYCNSILAFSTPNVHILKICPCQEDRGDFPKHNGCAEIGSKIIIRLNLKHEHLLHFNLSMSKLHRQSIQIGVHRFLICRR